MIRRLLPLLLLAACAHPAPEHSAAHAVRRLHPPEGARYLPDDFVILVDGVPHTDSTFQALGLTGAQIDSMRVCRAPCSGPSLVVYTNRAAVQRPPE